MKIIYTFLLFSSIIMDVKSQDTIKIGKQIWMTENLTVSKFRNGDVIQEAKTNEEWVEAILQKKPAWCYYENQRDNELIYGKLYNVYAVIDSRGLAPNGFHIPNEKEWNQLCTSLGGQENAGKKLKTTEGWCNNGSGNDSSGFSGKPGGFRIDSGDFINLNCGGYWWSTDKVVFYLNWSNDAVAKNDGAGGGYSIRCIKN